MYLEFSLQVDKSKFTVASCDNLGLYGKSLCFACLPWMFDILDNEREPSSIVIV